VTQTYVIVYLHNSDSGPARQAVLCGAHQHITRHSAVQWAGPSFQDLCLVVNYNTHMYTHTHIWCAVLSTCQTATHCPEHAWS
jgi:hypothetical protein